MSAGLPQIRSVKPITELAQLSNPSDLAVGETVILLHPALPVAGVSIGMEGERQQNDSLADG